jgi:hypothetical protein
VLLSSVAVARVMLSWLAASAGVDNGAIAFHGVRIPRENLLDKFAAVRRPLHARMCAAFCEYGCEYSCNCVAW